MALFLCFVMLLGTTYAWFTDGVTSANNVIKSGTLNVEMYYADGAEAVPADDSADWKNAQGVAIYKADQLWEPGYTDAKHIKISNEGTLALKYQLAIIPRGEVSKLAEVIDVYYIEDATQIATREDLAKYTPIGTLADLINNGIKEADLAAGTDYTATLVLKMRDEAGNEYQDLSIGDDFTIRLIATQCNENAWGAVAEVPTPDANGVVDVYTAEQLAGVMANTSGIKTINIKEDIDLIGRTWVPAYVSAPGLVINGNGHTISNMTVNGKAANQGFIGVAYQDITINDLTFKDAEVNSTGSFVGTVIGWAWGNANVTLNNVDVVDSEVSATIANKSIHVGGLIGFFPYDGGELTLKGCDVSGSTIAGYHNVGAMVGTTLTQKTVTVENCTAKNNTLVYGGDNIGAFAFGAYDSGYAEYVPASGFTAENNAVICRVYTHDQLAAAIKSPAIDLITVAPGAYGVIDVRVGRKLTIEAMDGAIVKLAGINGQSNNNASDITIKNIIIDNSLATAGWYTGTSQNMKPCVGVWGGNYTFENCTFNVTGASGAETGVMSWWTTNVGTMTFNGCTFNGANEKARAMQIYGKYNLNVEGCTFNTEKDYSIKYVGAENLTATFKNNTVNNTVNFVQTGSAPYAGKDYALVFEGNTLATGINHVFVDNDENQTITVDGNRYVGTAAQLAKAVAAGVTDIYLLDGTYDVYGCGGKTLTISGSKNAIIKLYNDGEDGCDYAFGSAGTGVGTYTFNGVTFDTTSNTGNYKGFAYMKGIFNDCNFVGAYSLNNANDFVFNRCTFDFKNGYFWTWGAKSVTFDGCTFNGNSKAILAHGTASTVININNCKFAATEKGYTGAGDNTAVVEMDPVTTNTYTINFTGENTITDSYAGWTRVKDSSTGHVITGLN
jgi:hypothetical protein